MRPPRRRYSSVSRQNQIFSAWRASRTRSATASLPAPARAAALAASTSRPVPPQRGFAVDHLDALAVAALGEQLAGLARCLERARDAAGEMDRDDVVAAVDQRLPDGQEVADRRLGGGRQLGVGAPGARRSRVEPVASSSSRTGSPLQPTYRLTGGSARAGRARVEGSACCRSRSRQGACAADALCEHLGQLARLVHLDDDVTAADELAVGEQLGDRRPVGDRRELLADARVGQHVDRGERRVERLERGDRARREAARGRFRACPS